jgi:hypothetical protein
MDQEHLYGALIVNDALARVEGLQLSSLFLSAAAGFSSWRFSS